MTKIVRFVVMTTILLFVTPATAGATEEMSVSELITESEALSGTEVAVLGELVGDYGFRDDGWMWTQLNGDDYVRSPLRDGGQPVGGNTGVGIRMPSELGEGLGPPGGYRIHGPIVKVIGVWRWHDPARQGESFLEVSSVTIVEPGRAIAEEPLWIAIWVGLGLVGGSFVLWRRGVRLGTTQ